MPLGRALAARGCCFGCTLNVARLHELQSLWRRLGDQRIKVIEDFLAARVLPAPLFALGTPNSVKRSNASLHRTRIDPEHVRDGLLRWARLVVSIPPKRRDD